MKKVALALVLISGVAMAQAKKDRKPLDPCGSPQEVFTKYMLDKCYKGYFDAIMESRRLAEEASKKADEASKKAGDLEGRVKKLEGIADDHERRIRALEGRPAPAPAPAPKREEGVGPYKWQLEEVGVVLFDFNKFNIKASEAKKLDDIVEKLKGESKEILVVGFADTRGTSQYNFNLSMWRAQMVASHLARKGVDIGKIRVASYGKEVADLISPKHAQQRAVRIYLVK
ncbi:MAG: OmpA family protein [Aquificaceae bacterium]|nr:OmpA family protein [Aquificaceae bacterium]MDW8423494.1 OmpA family protein [Aquificaceae bacterium]